MVKAAYPIPSSDDLERYAGAALENARHLVRDAEILLRSGSWPRAYSLAVLALEEAGKAYWCYGERNEQWAEVAARHGWSVEQCHRRLSFWPHRDKGHLMKLSGASMARGDGVLGELSRQVLEDIKTASSLPPVNAVQVGGDSKGGDAAPTSESAAELFMRVMLPLVQRASAEDDDTAKAINRGKQRGLYVDYSDGSVRLPAEIDEDEAAAMLADARNTITQVELLS